MINGPIPCPCINAVNEKKLPRGAAVTTSPACSELQHELQRELQHELENGHGKRCNRPRAAAAALARAATSDVTSAPATPGAAGAGVEGAGTPAIMPYKFEPSAFFGTMCCRSRPPVAFFTRSLNACVSCVCMPTRAKRVRDINGRSKGERHQRSTLSRSTRQKRFSKIKGSEKEPREAHMGSSKRAKSGQ
jgi:hypothetical protein